MTDMGTATKMNGSLIICVEETDKLGGSTQVLHNVAVNPRGDHRIVAFAYYNDVEDRAVESIPFQKGLLAEKDDRIFPDMMTRLLQHLPLTRTLISWVRMRRVLHSQKRSPPEMPCSFSLH